ncbi:DUF2326 domain-containing protein [Paenibacillus popilliae]|uniref:DUF2326 domain-containing protein n=1 Tax=Paenibacillus popilliae TaxID=78057 RepID=UPI0002E07610|nr:DUF2326 domain-containing protein [Paenibacillus popilliae]
MHFLLNDKKELMHDNQLIKVADYVSRKNIQLVVSILKDKLPVSLLDKAHIVVELIQVHRLLSLMLCLFLIVSCPIVTLSQNSYGMTLSQKNNRSTKAL